MSRLRGFLHSFAGRMALAALATHLLLAFFLAAGMNRIISGDLESQFVNLIRLQGRQLGTSLEGTAEGGIQGAMQDWLLGGQIVYAEFVPARGRAMSVRSGPDRLSFQEDRAFGEHDDEVFFLSVPVVREDGPATLRLGFDERPVRERARTIYERGLLLVLAYLVAALLLAMGAGRLLSRSIRQLRDAARQVAVGQTGQALMISTDIREVASLTQDLEFMRRELVRRGEELKTLAYYDGLTGLANRELFGRRLADALELAHRNGSKLALLYLDLDRFKRVNDTLGHSVGDQLLVNVAQRLEACLAPAELAPLLDEQAPAEAIARLGGDEFVILLRRITNSSDAARIADRVLEALCEPIMLASHLVYATTSIGIAVYPFDGPDANTLLKNADAAMYAAKQQGKNRFQYYMDSMNLSAGVRLALESDLHLALERNQLVLHYQPQIDLRTGRLAGAEALLRWHHPARGMLVPAEFIQLAEESGQIISIGEWAIRNACAQLREWDDARLAPFPLAVNVSARQFQQPSFAQTVAEALREYRVRPGSLTLEITETALMANEDDAIARIEELAALDVRLAIDDFGTGYSSLAYLKRFAV
jgi:diguanylate cyclase (GGDEF)-like protein